MTLRQTTMRFCYTWHEVEGARTATSFAILVWRFGETILIQTLPFRVIVLVTTAESHPLKCEELFRQTLQNYHLK